MCNPQPRAAGDEVSYGPRLDRVHGHTAPYLNESSMKGLRVYGPSFSGNNKFLNLCLTSKTNILL